jgi:Mrp family chromosome partitioning ATPase
LTQLSRFDGTQERKMDEENTYDLVIINAPPFSERSDALRLAQAADQVLLVVKCRTSHRQAVAQAADALKAVGAAGSGLVFSSVPPDSDPVFF